ncbi:probable LRR receptor-like serine/threonine-protein kinase At1g74360 isoform X2 [Selaginella moellendorffii]|uniref:probable LRR receptor-like serine/threonine-protein kinase At1g74360 isoform X2 n=1 Tax=Selaginella moellendorffii TaxID=88036 RepID=UPI000D1C7526|nr:probable LRR receptor-like serine/threonine-protein kinase At1g74360 isoform X2 [Selaginella moellendorffii]|eukprot:XP_002977841.2 probable LRR receptor-like serine/threonine-protein kinase At1g74360 isoform X2 [Selaginella moellendorffii]
MEDREMGPVERTRKCPILEHHQQASSSSSGGSFGFPASPVCSRLNLLLLISLASLLLQVPGAYATRDLDHRPDDRSLVGRATSLSLQQEMQALLSFKASIVAHNPGKSSILDGWNPSDGDPCKWGGIQCSQGPEGVHVTAIDLSSNNLAGSIPEGLANLSYLSSLSLALNSFSGRLPGDLSRCSSLAELDLSSNQLHDTIPPSLLDELPSLATINLAYNDLVGGIPDEFFSPRSCANLQALNLSSNPGLGGPLPGSLKNCRAIELLDVSSCNLTGSLPDDTIARLPLLSNLVLRENGFVGEVSPEFFSSCQNLESLDLALNNLTGDIPAQIENCSKLVNLAVSANSFHSLPREIGGLSALERLLATHNGFTELPAELERCSKIRVLAVSGNSLSGPLPGFIAKFSSLEFLSVYTNRFVGAVPAWLGGLRSLRHLDASNNLFTGEIPVEISGASELQFLLLAGNALSGEIPREIGSKLLNLQVLDLSHNQISGRIPPSLGNLKFLLWLMLASNDLEGEIPAELGNCSSLLWLNAASNRLSGSLPESIASIGSGVNATFALNARTLPLIPKGMGECEAVRRWIPSQYPPFDLISTVMTVERCRSFWNLLLRGIFMYPLCPSRPSEESMGYIQLASNRLTGPIPGTLDRCRHLGLLFLDQNNLTGSMPQSYSIALTGLNVSRNALSGSVPRSIGALSCVVSLDLSYNNLSGRIPSELQNLSKLNRFNISYNPELVGPVPSGQQFSTFGPSVYEGDLKLCSSSSSVMGMKNPNSSLPSCGKLGDGGGDGDGGGGGGGFLPRSSRIAVATVVGISLACTLGLIVLALLGFCLLGKAAPPGPGGAAMDFVMVGGKEHHRHFAPDHAAAASVQVSLFSVELPKHLTYSDLVSATSNFDETNVVGSGGFGIVYKAKLADGSTVAIKKLIQEGPQADREFLAEMETLGHLHHENLVPLLGCSSYGTQKLLVYKYMEKGSLDDWLHEKPGGAQALEWPIRLNIALGIARGLKFLHHNCSPPIVHRDMKASNILLDDNFEPRLTDFGLARVLGAQETHVSTVVAGTLGYVPPEYCQTWRATARGDVYSFGVVLLELVTGRRPMSISFGGENKDHGCGNLIEWSAYHVKKGIAAEVCDRIVLRSAAPGELLAFLRLAVVCTAELPIRRPTMREVLKVLEEIKAGNYAAMLQGSSQGGHQFR